MNAKFLFNKVESRRFTLNWRQRSVNHSVDCLVILAPFHSLTVNVNYSCFISVDCRPKTGLIYIWGFFSEYFLKPTLNIVSIHSFTDFLKAEIKPITRSVLIIGFIPTNSTARSEGLLTLFFSKFGKYCLYKSKVK